MLPGHSLGPHLPDPLLSLDKPSPLSSNASGGHPWRRRWGSMWSFVRCVHTIRSPNILHLASSTLCLCPIDPGQTSLWNLSKGCPPPMATPQSSILTVVTDFPRWHIPLSKPPSSPVFLLHDFPCNVVSNRGPQFVSLFWNSFCSLPGATVSLFIKYHPQVSRRWRLGCAAW